MTKKDAEKAVKALFDTIGEALAKEEKVQVIGFGTFEVRTRAERIWPQPSYERRNDNSSIQIPSFQSR